MQFGIGFSSSDKSKTAAEEALTEALKHVVDPVFAIIFTTNGCNHETVIKTAKKFLENSKLAGICGGGIITSEGVMYQGVGVLIMGGTDLRAETSFQIYGSRDPREVGESAGEELLKSGILKGTVFIFHESSSKNISETITGLYNVMGPDYIYMGGGSGDNFNSNHSYQFTNEGVSEGALAVALVEGLSFENGFGHGWRPKNVPLIMNEATNKKIIEINGRRAADVCAEESDNFEPQKLKKYGLLNPLGFPDLSNNFLIRDPIKINPDGSMEFITEISRYSVGYLMEAGYDDLIISTIKMARKTLRNEKPLLVLIFHCIFRHMIMENLEIDGINVLKDVFGEDVPIFGVLTFGEIGSYFDVPVVQNKTMMITAFYHE
ncbi:MAG: FIST C-terminal domain-containing protein [Methanobacterium sp.]|nr:FIST C-terminal domain-containing protein [Methanobacterium sp.]